MQRTKRESGLYAACTGICLGGAIMFFMLMVIARDVIYAEELLTPHALDIFAYCFGSTLPCVAAVALLVMVIREIAQNRAFSERNARFMRWIAWMAFLECAYLIAGCIGYMSIGLMHPGIMLIVAALVFVGGGIGLLAWALARLIRQASALQQESDLTV